MWSNPQVSLAFMFCNDSLISMRGIFWLQVYSKHWNLIFQQHFDQPLEGYSFQELDRVNCFSKTWFISPKYVMVIQITCRSILCVVGNSMECRQTHLANYKMQMHAFISFISKQNLWAEEHRVCIDVIWLSNLFFLKVTRYTLLCYTGEKIGNVEDPCKIIPKKVCKCFKLFMSWFLVHFEMLDE